MNTNKIITSAFGAALIVCCAACDSGKPALQTPDSGKINRLYVNSPQMGREVTVDVWMPEGFNLRRERRYPVIFMHDGQNLFDAATTWNHQAWEMDSVTGKLIEAGMIDAPVIVGIHSVKETRRGDLMPADVIPLMKTVPDSTMLAFIENPPVKGNEYAAFIVETLRPQLIERYNLTTNRDSTFVMGSSMGGLMSVYAMSEYPDVFGGAGCLSTHWIGTKDGNPAFPEAMLDYLRLKMPRDGEHKVYFDHGTVELDGLYSPWEEKVLSLMDSLGYQAKGNGVAADEATIDSYVDEGARHEEKYWKRRVERPLRFLLGTN